MNPLDCAECGKEITEEDRLRFANRIMGLALPDGMRLVYYCGCDDGFPLVEIHGWIRLDSMPTVRLPEDVK